MTDENQVNQENLTTEQVAIQAPDILDTPIEAITENAAIAVSSDPIANTTENIASEPIGDANNAISDPVETAAEIPEVAPIDEQALAEQAGIIATGSFHLTNIYNKKVNETHAKTANLVVQIMKAAERAVAWTHEEVSSIWDRVESELKATL